MAIIRRELSHYNRHVASYFAEHLLAEGYDNVHVAIPMRESERHYKAIGEKEEE